LSLGKTMTTVADLYLLQEMDLEIQAKQAALADVETRLGESEEVEEARREVEEQRHLLREAQKKQREAEWRVEEVRVKIQPVEKRLYGGTVKNPKELVGLQQDVDSLRARQRELEDRDLEAMSAVEEAERGLAEAERRRSDLEARWQAEQESLRGPGGHDRRRDDTPVRGPAGAAPGAGCGQSGARHLPGVPHNPAHARAPEGAKGQPPGAMHELRAHPLLELK
jgi:hypothetical protein